VGKESGSLYLADARATNTSRLSVPVVLALPQLSPMQLVDMEWSLCSGLFHRQHVPIRSPAQCQQQFL
jgi:hypothetical protein